MSAWQVIHGDSTQELKNVLCESMNPIIVTDPPFNVGYHYDECRDNKPDEEYFSWLSALLGDCPAVVIHYPEALYKLAASMKRTPNRIVSWCYNSNTPRQHRDIAYFGVSPCFDGLGEYKNPTDKRIAERIAQGKKPIGYDWLYCDQVKFNSSVKCDHPCQMPLSVMLYIINTLPPNATIIDPFAGSGTTLLAAKRLNRDCVGIEMSAKYCAIIHSRLSNDSPLLDLCGQ